MPSRIFTLWKSEWTRILSEWRLWRVAIVLAGFLGGIPMAASAATPDVALDQLLQSAHDASAVPGTCAKPDTDRLIKAFCVGHIRAGVRDDYPLFGSTTGPKRSGYEITVVQEIAKRLGLDVEFVKVKPANRISMLGDDHIDFVIATMGDTVQRESQARFINRHFPYARPIRARWANDNPGSRRRAIPAAP